MKRQPISIRVFEKSCGARVEGLEEIVSAVTAGKKVVFIGGAKWAVLKWLEKAAAAFAPKDITISKDNLKIAHLPTGGELTFIGNRDDLEDWLKQARYDHWAIGVL
ncbi:hypothetical protein [Rhizobium sp. GCM10022189]|uniref:hypothetical protein n=1 Tax=Rhizobium sp. GCM10022189 TaxID=3252654 RepID=UPI00360B0904